jgi:phage FluMu protein Com
MSNNPENEIIVTNWAHPKCPYCENVDETIDQECLDDYDKIECAFCGKMYAVAISVEFVSSGDYRNRIMN